MPAPYITKGDKVHVEFFAGKDPGTFALTGFQMKVTGSMISVLGTCVHFRGDHPTNPTQTRLYIDVTEGELPDHVKLVKPHGCMHDHGHLEVREEWIRAVEKGEPVEAYLASLRAYNKSRSEVNQKRVDAHFFVLSGPDQARAIHIAKGEGLLTPDKG